MAGRRQDTIHEINKNLSYRKEAARCSVSLKILLSLWVTQGHSNLHRWV